MSKIYSPSGLVVGDPRDYVEVRPVKAAFAVCVKVTPKKLVDERLAVGYTTFLNSHKKGNP